MFRNKKKGEKTMGMNKRIRDNRDKLELKTIYNKESKTRCPCCHRFTLFIKEKGKPICLRCKEVINK